MDQKEIPLSVINAVSYSKQLVSGTVSITNGANVTGIEKINAVAAPIMAKTIREQMAAIKSPAPSQTAVQPTTDIPDEIRKYKQLLDENGARNGLLKYLGTLIANDNINPKVDLKLSETLKNGLMRWK